MRSSPALTGLAASLTDTDNVIQESPSTAFYEEVQGNPLDAVDHYCRSQQGWQRLCYTQSIAAAAATAEYGDVLEVVLPLVERLARDEEAEIRAAVVKQLHGLGTALYRKDAERSMRDIEATLLVCAQQCALDDDDEVGHPAITAFQQLVQLLPPARATAASKRAVDRLESQGSDEGTLAAVRLLAHTVSCWTPEALRRHVPRYVSRWACHRDFAVREAAATCLSLVLPPLALRLCHQVLLPACYQLCRDQNWRVRRACALDLPRLAEALQQRPEQHEASSSSSQAHDDAASAGQCASRASSCLGLTSRMGSDTGAHSQSTANLLAAGAASGGPQRNKSFPSLAQRAPATSAQIMTKHPMHSSLIMDSLLSGDSPASSAPGSPAGSSGGCGGGVLSQQDSFEQQQEEEEAQQQREEEEASRQQQQQQQAAPSCVLNEAVPLLHDCWCALRQCMELLTADSSHWVKVAALSGLGPFLLQLPPCQVGQLLLGRFTSMAGSSVVIYEVSVALACAQAFGQLVVLLGPERWHDMRDAWHALQASRDPQVLCAVAACLPRLMAALGPALTKQELVPALAALLQSHLSWIGPQLVLVIGDLLEGLPHSEHEVLLKTLPQLCGGGGGAAGERSRSWRLRRDLALQLGRMAAAAGPEAVEQSLWPTAMSLCRDPVAAVRTAAAAQLGPILASLPAGVLQQRDGSGAAALCAGACSSSSFSGAIAPAVGAGPAALDSSSGGTNCTRSDDQQQAGAEPVPAAEQSRSRDVPMRQRSKSRVRFADDVSAGADGDGGCSSSSSPSRRLASSEGMLAGLVAAGQMRGDGSSSSVCHGGSHMDDFDDMALPSALAPAGFGSPDSSGSDEDSAASSSSSTCSGLSSSSTSSSRSSRDGSGLCDSGRSSGASSSDGDEEASSSGSEDGDDDGAAAAAAADGGDAAGGSSGSSTEEQHEGDGEGAHPWAGLLSPPPRLEQEQQELQAAAGSGGLGLPGTPEPSSSDGYYTPSGHHLTPPERPRLAMHPAMMPVGAVSAAAAAGGGTSAPRAVPSSSARSPGNASGRQAHQRTRSTGDLLRLATSNSAAELVGTPTPTAAPTRHGGHDAGLASAPRASPQRSASAHALATSLPTDGSCNPLGGTCSDDEGDGGSSQRSRRGGHGPAVSRFGCCLPQPADAAPHQYLPCLLHYLGCSSSFQDRQLFVPIALGLLSACHGSLLSCVQQGVLLDRLEALAHDPVAGVRYAVATALAEVRAQAAALTGGPAKPQQQEEVQQEVQQAVEVRQQQLADAGSAGVTAALELPQSSSDQQQQQPQQDDGQSAPGVPKGAHPLLGYHAYVQQLSRQSSGTLGSSSGGGDANGTSSSSSSAAISIGQQHRTAAADGTAASRLVSSSSAPAPSTLLHSSSNGHVQRSSSTTTSSSRPPLPASAAHALRSRRSEPSSASLAAAGAAAASAAAGAVAEGGGADAAAGQGPADWLLNLSNCQQLERLMHVVALTAGPAC